MATGEQIKKARESLGESQAAFAGRFRVNQATVHRWEAHGLPERGTARIVVEAFLENLKASQPQGRAA